MTDEQTTPAEEPSADASGAADATAETGTADSWQDVVRQLDALGVAIGRWARAAVNDPDNRKHAEEFKGHMEKMADSVAGAIDNVSNTDVGQQFKEAANKTGEAFKTAGEKVSDEVAPRMVSAFRATAEKLHQAAERLEHPAEAAPSDEPSVENEDEGTSV